MTSAAAVGLALAVAVVPVPILATASVGEQAAAFGLESELNRLQATREQLWRRRALRASLEGRAAVLDAEIEALERQRQQTATTLQDQRAEVAMIERRLDHLVPRALAHDAELRARREQVGRLLGGLASSTRRVELDQTIRARLLALGPVMLRRLRGAEERLASVEQQPEAALDRQAAIERQVPLLMAEAERLRQEGQERSREREVTRARLAELNVEMAGLEDDQEALSQRLLINEAAHVARAGPQADQPALADPGQPGASAVTFGAAVKGRLPARSGTGFAAEARQPAAPELIAVAAHRPSALTTVRLDLPAMSPPPSKPLDVALKGDVGVLPLGDAPGGTALDVVFLEPAPLADVGSRVATARLRRVQPPLVPVPGEMVNPFSDQVGASAGSDLTVPAAPGQPVAAPEAGQVVFAGTFRSYGNLLIIEHQREYHTLLWGLSKLEVAKGDQVRTGQVVGVMADDAGRRPQLHVELRHNGRPVNPLPWLAASSNKVRG